MKRSASEVTWMSPDPEAQFAELIKQNINAIKDNNEAVQKMNDSVAKLQVVVESNIKRLDDITAEIKAINQNIDELKAASTNPIRLPSPSAPMELVVANASHGVSIDNNGLDHEMEKGMARSEVTFRHKVDNISKLKESQLSPPFTVRNLPWKIMFMPKSTLTEEGQSQKSLGFFVQCNGESESTTWSCYAVTEFRLLSVKIGQVPFSRKTQFLYDTKKNVSGFSHFMLWNDILNPDKGYIENDAITLEVNIVADAPHGLSYEIERGMTRSEATFRYTFENISEMEKSQLSPPRIVRNLPWKMQVQLESSQTQEGQPQKSLGFYLWCNKENKSTTWSCYAEAELRLLPVKEGQAPLSKKVRGVFYSQGNRNSWGFKQFILWNDVLDPDRGYIKDDAITFEVHIVADAPYGVN